MMCYLDTTFCTAKCGTVDCPVKLTPEVIAAAERWYGEPDAPIAQCDRSEGCERWTEVACDA